MEQLNSLTGSSFNSFSCIALGTSSLLYLGKKYFNGPFPTCTRDLKGKVVIVTGSNTGVGKATAEHLLKSGATVVYACRDEGRANDAISELEESLKPRAKFLRIDLSSFESVNNFVQEFKRNYKTLDILVNNAGLWNDGFHKSKEGIELTYHANYFGPIYLTLSLLDYFNKEEGRIVNLSSWGAYHSWQNVESCKRLQEDLDFRNMERSFSGNSIYVDSKLGNHFFNVYLSELLAKKYPQIVCAAVHPGLIMSDLGRNFVLWKQIIIKLTYPIFWYFAKPPLHGAATSLYICYEDYKKIKSGRFYANCGEWEFNRTMASKEIREEFMKWTWMVFDKYLDKKFDIKSLQA